MAGEPLKWFIPRDDIAFVPQRPWLRLRRWRRPTIKQVDVRSRVFSVEMTWHQRFNPEGKKGLAPCVLMKL